MDSTQLNVSRNRKPRSPRVVTCDNCGESFETHKPAKKFCSQICQFAAYKQRQRDLLADLSEQMGHGECVVCGGRTKVAISSGRPFKYCSEECRRRVRLANAGQELKRRCSVCGAEFTTRIPNKKYCSGDCRKNSENERRRRREGGGNSHKRRARRMGRRCEFINPQEVFERDHWICRICYAPVDQDVVFPDPMAATLDHIEPLSRGGHHTMDNVQCAHWMCNRAKGNRMGNEIHEDQT